LVFSTRQNAFKKTCRSDQMPGPKRIKQTSITSVKNRCRSLRIFRQTADVFIRMSGPKRCYYAIAAIGVVCATLASVYAWRPPDYSHVVLRAGVGNDSLSKSLNPEGRVDSLADEVLAAAASRIGIHLIWVDCPDGPAKAFETDKIDLWPLGLALSNRKKKDGKSVRYTTEPWLAVERSLVTEGAPPKRWDGVRVAYGLAVESQLLLAAPGAVPVHTDGEVTAVGSICTGEASAAYVLTQSLGAFILKKPHGCETADLRVTPVTGKPLKLGISSTFKAAREADELRIEIGRMAAAGALEELFNKYSLYSSADTAGIYELMDANRRTEVFQGCAAGLVIGLAIVLWQLRRIREARRAADAAKTAAETASRAKSELVRVVEEKTADLRRANEDLLRLSSLDPLTGLANRRVFDQTIERECARVMRTDSAVSLVILDIDHFKALNDSEGHQRGDEYLILVGAELRRLARRRVDVAARYGGEEFAVILPETNPVDALRFAESMRLAIAGLELPHPSSPVAPVLTVSVGVATATRELYSTPGELIAGADHALYKSKRNGRNRVETAPRINVPQGVGNAAVPEHV
jgi:diguanylate cyclase (GGDEF)-like protein